MTDHLVSPRRQKSIDDEVGFASRKAPALYEARLLGSIEQRRKRLCSRRRTG